MLLLFYVWIGVPQGYIQIDSKISNKDSSVVQDHPTLVELVNLLYKDEV